MENVDIGSLIGKQVFYWDELFGDTLVGTIAEIVPQEGGSLFSAELIYRGDESENRCYDVLGDLLHSERHFEFR